MVGLRPSVRFFGTFGKHWAGPRFRVAEAQFEHLVSVYAAPGAFRASLGWYRASAGALARVMAERPPSPKDRIAVPTTVLWPDHDPLFPYAWSDQLDQYFAELRIRQLTDVGHFVPLECPREFAAAVAAASVHGS
jgi:pimeloyl-ACP methyl ester carboxylesterase